MFTHLVKKPTGYICGNCRMKQQEIKDTCWFCGYFFSNYEVVLLENYKEQSDETFE
jgi:predicted amidophosphoribosyltransferase